MDVGPTRFEIGRRARGRAGVNACGRVDLLPRLPFVLLLGDRLVPLRFRDIEVDGDVLTRFSTGGSMPVAGTRSDPDAFTGAKV